MVVFLNLNFFFYYFRFSYLINIYRQLSEVIGELTLDLRMSDLGNLKKKKYFEVSKKKTCEK